MTSSQLRFWPDAQPLVERLGRTFFRALPERPGVYMMEGAGDIVLYVGKAKSLRHRLGSYRVANPERMARRTLRLLRLVERIRWEECPDEPSALRREAELLRALRPKFNRAGVWPGQPRFIAWRREASGMILAIVSELPEGWQGLGPFGGQAVPLHHALARLLWCWLCPERGLPGLPVGWLHGRVAPSIRLSVTEAEGLDQLEELLRALGAEEIEPLKRTSIPPRDRMMLPCWEEDLQTVADAIEARRRV